MKAVWWRGTLLDYLVQMYPRTRPGWTYAVFVSPGAAFLGDYNCKPPGAAPETRSAYLSEVEVVELRAYGRWKEVGR